MSRSSGRFAWLLAGLGAVAAGARFFRRAPASAPTAEQEQGDPRADELKRRIEEARGLEEEREAFEEAETPVDRVDPAENDPDARRRHVHERGRAALDRMRADSPE